MDRDNNFHFMVAYKKKMNKKGGSGIIILIIVALLLVYLASTNKIVVNDSQFVTATGLTCKAIHKQYDPVSKVCITPAQDVQQTIP